MKKGLTFVLLVLIFLKTGRSKSRITVLQRLEDGGLNVTCSLLSEDKVSQINWEMVMGQNRSKLGTLHPQYGTHISSGYKGNVEMQSDSFYRTSSIKLIKMEMSNSSKHCCTFITFPSGPQEACADFSSIKTEEAPKSDAHEQPVPDEWWKVLPAITIVSILALIASYYLHRGYYKSRRQVFQVEQTFLTDLTDLQIDTAESSREPPQPPQESSEAFDPSKLYSKIKIDYYYGRLWKAYERNTRGWAKGPQPAIYHLLGKQPPQQKDNKEPQQD